MKVTRKAAVLLLRMIMFSGCTCATIAQTFITFDIPNAVSEMPGGLDLVVTSINDGKAVTGYFTDGSQNYRQRGFIRDRFGNITVVDAPNARGTSIRSINNSGDTAGYFTDIYLGKARGFVRDRYGRITVFDVPNNAGTDVESISDSGLVAGMTFDGSWNIHGYLRDATGGIAVFDALNADATYVSGVNARGDVAGYFSDVFEGNTRLRGYVRLRTGEITAFDGGGLATYTTAINAAREITGGYGVSNVNGFIWDKHSTLVPFGVSSAMFDVAGRAINARGDVVGYYYDLNQLKVRSFLRDSLGSISVFDAPNASDTRVVGINGAGDIAGWFEDVSIGGKIRGFIRIAH